VTKQPKHILGLAVLMLLISGLACNAIGGAGGEPTATPRPSSTPIEEATEDVEPTEEAEPTEADEPTEEPTEEIIEEDTEEAPTEGVPEDGVLFSDDFSDPDSGWGDGENETALREYRDGQYVIEIFETGWFIWVNPDAGSLFDTRTTVTITNAGDALDPTFGVICNYQDDGAFHYMGIGPDGYYAIVRTEGEDDIFLTSDENLWIQSDDIEINADSYTLEAICAGDGTLTLIVNGVEIDSVQDDTYTEGDIGLFALSFEQSPVEVHFDDLTVVSPP
jgi:hypothetical protein